MSEDRPLGRGAGAPALSEEDKARIRAEEEYRASVRTGLEAAAPVTAEATKAAAPRPSPKQLQEERLAAERLAQDREAQGGPKRNPFLMTADQRAAYDQVKRERMTPEDRAQAGRKNALLGGVAGLALLACGGILLKSCGQDYLQSREAARSRAAAAAAAALTLGGQSAYTIQASCQESVKSKLKAPSTAQFVGGSLPAFDGTAWNWTGEVDAQNSFGAQIRTSFACTVSGTTPEDARVSTVLLN